MATEFLESSRFFRVILDGLNAHVAILDHDGVICAVNAPWQRFAEANGFLGASYGIGSNYLAICEKATGECAEEAPAVAHGLRAILKGQRDTFRLTYPCHGPSVKRWFQVHARRVVYDGDDYLVVAHENVTEIKLAERQVLLSHCRSEALLELAQMRSATLEQVACFAVERGVEVTESRAAVLGFLSDDGATIRVFIAERGEDGLTRHPVTDASRPVEEACCWSAVLQQRAAVMLNDMSSEAPQHNLPSGAAVFRCLGVPVLEGENVRAVAMVANKAEPYDESDLVQLTLLANGVWNVVQARRADEELARYRRRLEELVDQRTNQLRESQVKLHQAERLASVGTLAAGIAHEINNPIGMIQLAAENTLTTSPMVQQEQRVADALSRIVANARRCGQIVRSVLKFARHEPTEKWPGDLNEVVVHAARTLAGYLAEKGDVLSLQLAPALPNVIMNPIEIEQVLANLIRNAVQSSDRPVRIEVRTDRRNDHLMLRVTDDGPGIPPQIREHLFDPFATTRRERGGTGLGLSLVHGIVVEHRGTIEVDTAAGIGTTIHIELPIAPSPCEED